MNKDVIIYTDGCVNGNPGDIGIGGVIYLGFEKTFSFSDSAGYGTNNDAEYLAIIRALEFAKDLPAKSITVCSDSQLCINQINGIYKCKKDELQTKLFKINKIKASLSCPIEFMWIGRDSNPEADALASEACSMPQALVKDDLSIVFWEEVKDMSKDFVEKTLLCSTIQKLNSLQHEVGYKEMFELRNPYDSYSDKEDEELSSIICIRFGQASLEWLNESVRKSQKDYKRDAFLWCARGLYPPLALKKASVNQEQKNRWKKN